MTASKEKEIQSAVTHSISKSINKTVTKLLADSIKKGIFDAVLIPMVVPAKDSYVYVFIKDPSLLADADFLPPIMSNQGAKVVSSVTRLGVGTMNIAVVMRPCEIRATIELSKRYQVSLDTVTLISMDCPGVIPLSEFDKNPAHAKKKFDEAVPKNDTSIMRPVCQICEKSSMIAGDIHIATRGLNNNMFALISKSDRGTHIIEQLNLKNHKNIDSWTTATNKQAEEKQKKRQQIHAELKKKATGLNSITDTFSKCINCHNCMRACPVCFCRLCYFESNKVKRSADDYLQSAENKGSMRFIPDTTLFHLGRMMHMSLSCVSCGSCEDACPMSIPVAQIFSMIADETQALFQYSAGRSRDESLPLKTYEEDEFHEVEDDHD